MGQTEEDRVKFTSVDIRTQNEQSVLFLNALRNLDKGLIDYLLETALDSRGRNVTLNVLDMLSGWGRSS